MNKIKIVEEVILKYERQKDGSNISLYKNELDNPPFMLSSVPLKELIFNSLNSKSFRSIDEEYIKYILKDLELIQKELKCITLTTQLAFHYLQLKTCCIFFLRG